MKVYTQLLSLFFVLGFFLNFKAQDRPNWVKNFPIDTAYYIGIGSSEKSNPNFQSLATKKALANIAEQIQINIKSESQMFVSEDQSGVDEDYFRNISTKTEMELQDFEKFKQWEDKKIYFVYYRLSKKKFRENLLVSYNLAILNSNQKIAEAELHFSKNQIGESIRAYLDASKFLEPLLKNSFIKEKHAEVFNLWQKTKTELNTIAQGFRLQHDPKPIKIKKSLLSDREFTVFTRFVKENENTPIRQVPVVFELSKNTNAFQKRVIISDENGVAKNRIENIFHESLNYNINCKINFHSYFNSFGDYKILDEIDFSNTQSALRVQLDVVPVTVSILSDEQSFSKARKFSTIKDELANQLKSKNILTAPSLSKADYIIKIKADTEQGSEFEGFFTSLLTVKFTLQDSFSSKTVYSGTVYDIKGVGLNYNSAASKAYANFNEQIQEYLLNDILLHIN